jgi:hypothetical protein
MDRCQPSLVDCIAHLQHVLKHDSSLDVQNKGLNNSGQDVHSRARYAYWHKPAKFWLEILLLVSDIRGGNQHSNCCRISGDEQLLIQYQGSPMWDMKAWEGKHAAWSSLKAVHGMSAQSLAQYVEANATKRFARPIYWKALKKGYAQSSLFHVQVPSFY